MENANHLGYQLQHIAAVLAKQADQVLQGQLGIGYAQLKLLLALENQPYLKQRDIAAQLGQTEASVSRQVKLMIGQGLLYVTRNPRNRREHFTQVTPEGVRVTEAAMAVLAQFHQPIFAGLSDKYQNQLSELFQSLHSRVCNLEHPAN